MITGHYLSVSSVLSLPLNVLDDITTVTVASHTSITLLSFPVKSVAAVVNFNSIGKMTPKTEIASFAMGCFWGTEALYGVTPGVIRTKVGYTGGSTPNPTYKNIADHTETVELEYDPGVISYSELLEIFWENHDPCVKLKRQYMSAIFYHNHNQKNLAEQSFQERLSRCPKTIHTLILPAEDFHNAEDYHQKYRLQAHKFVLDQLQINDTESLLTNSLAARLNGWLNGYGSLDQFFNEKTALGLDNNQRLVEYLTQQIPIAERHC